jgi:hypothetical protein
MGPTVRRIVLKPLSIVIGDRIGHCITRLFSKKMLVQIEGVATDTFIELLLKGMDLAFALSRGYRENITGFKANYLFRTRDGLVNASVLFANDDMKVLDGAIADWDVCVDFKNAEALRKFMFSKEQDILNSILANEVEVQGNLNLIYKFGFMARDLAHRLGGR